MDYLEIDALVQGIVYCEPAVKQDLGRRFAAYLGLKPGKAGADGGIDGEGEINGQRVYFQSKLSKNLLDASLVAEFWRYLTKYEADIGVMLAGAGYTSGFQSRLEQFPNIDKLKIHLLTLEDIFAETPKFEQAVIDLPPLQDLSSGKWASLR
ncbi:restriction endonuclease [Scytonema hofmannii PCC 7110]|uniref:Restriction endonuclease n=1 Tax=Scytonema hofmannii PCC 7110 TaxID=128403 RepID=A0A139WTA3_9CYAN|nr:restriction endonuclease [Scytonema hofmannii]KYC35650.1 restriction endonuclease [Scytonema hofmannii PCC 7110]